MGADNNFTIGATFDKSQLDASMAEGAAAINQIPQAFDVAFKEVSATTTRALRQISEETKAAAASIGQNWIEVAAATQEYTAAQREVRAASKLAADSSLNEAESLSVLAAAKHRAAAAAMDLRAAEQAAIGTQELEMASNTTLAESFAVLSERMNVSSATMRTALSGTAGMSSALGAALGVGFLGEYVDRLKDTVLHFEQLSRATGESISSLVQLEGAFQSQGVSVSNFGAILARLSEHMQIAAQQARGEESRAFNYFGISVNELKNKTLSANDVLMKMSDHMRTAGKDSAALGNAQLLLGRNSYQLVSVLKEGPAALERLKSGYKGYGDAVQGSAKDADKLQAAQTRLDASMNQQFLPLIGDMTAVLKGFNLVLDSVVDGVDLLLAGLLETGTSAFHVSEAIYDAGHGRLAAAKTDMQAATQDIVNLKNEWTGIWKDYKSELATIFAKSPVITPPTGTGGNGDGDLPPTGPSANALRNQKLQAMEQELADEQTQHSVSLGEELQFWASKESIFKEGTAQRLTIDKKIAALEAEIDKSSADLQKKFAEAGAAAYRDSQKRLTDDLTKDLDARTQAVLSAYRDQSAAGQEYAAGESAHSMSSLELARQEVEQRRQLGQESARNAIADLQQIAAAEHDLRMKTLQAKLSDDQALQAAGIPNRAAVQADLNAIQAEQDNFRAKISGFHSQIAEESKRTWDAIGQTINRALSESMRGVIQGTQSMSQAFRNMEVSILASTIQTLEQMATRYLLHEVQLSVMHAAGVEHRVATTAAGAAQEKSIGLLAMMEHITREAARTAASTFRSVMSTVPFPANVILAPIEAGAAFAGVEAFGALASARGGQWDVPQSEQLTLLHAKEMVLPAQYAEPLRQTVTSGKGMRGGDVHLHIQAVDAKSFETMLSDNSSALVRTLRKAHRSGMLTGRVS